MKKSKFLILGSIASLYNYIMIRLKLNVMEMKTKIEHLTKIKLDRTINKSEI
ncbi:hypothetical protein HYE03_02395 [Mycoplasmopsis bovis]|nr:hypothetical protein [Mycoplasmopsis bovis]QQH28077.1 hypothetical protein HYE03_02395 [Mycoplasmopsis bovis]